MQVSLNTKVNVEVATMLKAVANELGRSQAGIVEEALKDWFTKNEKKGELYIGRN